MLKYFYELLVKKIFPKINFILGNNAVEEKGVKSNYFVKDLLKIIKMKINIFNYPLKKIGSINCGFFVGPHCF